MNRRQFLTAAEPGRARSLGLKLDVWLKATDAKLPKPRA